MSNGVLLCVAMGCDELVTPSCGHYCYAHCCCPGKPVLAVSDVSEQGRPVLAPAEVSPVPAVRGRRRTKKVSQEGRRRPVGEGAATTAQRSADTGDPAKKL